MDLTPIKAVSGPFFGDVHSCQVQHFHQAVIRQENSLRLRDFTQPAVKALVCICVNLIANSFPSYNSNSIEKPLHVFQTKLPTQYKNYYSTIMTQTKNLRVNTLRFFVCVIREIVKI